MSNTIPKGTPVRVKYVSAPDSGDAWAQSVGHEGKLAHDYEGYGYVVVRFKDFEPSTLSYFPDELEYLA